MLPIKFIIKITTKNDLVFQGEEEEVPSADIYEALVEKIVNSVGTCNFKLIDAEGDVIIIPQAVMADAIIQIIKLP